MGTQVSSEPYAALKAADEETVAVVERAYNMTHPGTSFTEFLAAKGIDLGKPKPATPTPPSFVYFIGADQGPIKIGVTNTPEQRLAAIQTGHPYQLRVLAVREGLTTDEREYHRRFASARLHGEWFTRCPEIEAEIARLALPLLPNPLP